MRGVDVGTIFAIFVYVWRLMEKLDMMPQIVQQLMRLKDIRGRIEAGASIEAIAAQKSGALRTAGRTRSRSTIPAVRLSRSGRTARYDRSIYKRISCGCGIASFARATSPSSSSIQ